MRLSAITAAALALACLLAGPAAATDSWRVDAGNNTSFPDDLNGGGLPAPACGCQIQDHGSSTVNGTCAVTADSIFGTDENNCQGTNVTFYYCIEKSSVTRNGQPFGANCTCRISVSDPDIGSLTLVNQGGGGYTGEYPEDVASALLDECENVSFQGGNVGAQIDYYWTLNAQ